MSMNKIIVLIIAILAGAMVALALETGRPATPLSRPFTAVVKDLNLYGSTSVDDKPIGTVPAKVQLSYRKSEECEHWIYIDDPAHDASGWCLDWGGYYGEKANRDPDITKYQNELDYAITTLGYNPDAYKIESGTLGEIDYAHESVWDAFLKWVIIALVALAAVTAWIPLLPGVLKHGAGLFLAAAGAAEILYCVHYRVFDTYGDNQIFSMFVLGLVQIFAMLMASRDKRLRERWGAWLSVSGMAAVLVTSAMVIGIGKLAASVAGGLLNIAIGGVVLTVIYAIFKDKDLSGSSSGHSEPKKRNGTFDGCCGNCSLWNESTSRCGRYGNLTSYGDHCNGHIW